MRVVVEEEEITPPIIKPHSIDSLTLAGAFLAEHVCGGEVQSTEPHAEPSAAAPPGLGRSPSIMNAAAALVDASRDCSVLSDALGGSARRRLKMPRPSPAKRGRESTEDAAAAALAPASMWAVGHHVRILSSASLDQLKLLSAAYKICPTPTDQELHIISRYVGVPAEQLETWFESRGTLQEWVTQSPHLQPADLAKLFYSKAPQREVH